MKFKISGTVFLLIPFFKYQKRILTNLKISGTVFLLIPFFQILKKEDLQISKYLAQFFYSSPFSNIEKKNTYKSQIT